MGDRLTMSTKERARKAMMESVKRGHLNLVEASARLQLSYLIAPYAQPCYLYHFPYNKAKGIYGS